MSQKLHRLYVGLLIITGFASFIFLLINGIDYYLTPVEERFFSPLHNNLKPSGLIGHGLGIIGTLMMLIGVSIYMLRKRNYFSFGYLKHWLELHIFLCSLGPVFVLFHTAFKFGGIVSISFWSMTAVVFSGVIGRFVYVQIPRTIQGKELDANELNELFKKYSDELNLQLKENQQILLNINKLLEVKIESSNSFFSNTIGIIKHTLFVNKKIKEIKNELINTTGFSNSSIKRILSMVKEQLILRRKIKMLQAMQKVFKHWHIAHLPFAITMFVIMLIHVAVTIVFGYKWIF